MTVAQREYTPSDMHTVRQLAVCMEKAGHMSQQRCPQLNPPLPQLPAALAWLQASLVDVSHCVWERICLLVLGADTQPAAVLAKRTALLLVCKEVGAATRPVPLQLDLRCAADSAAVKRLLCAAAVSRLWLNKDVRGDEILRDEQFRALSGVTLRELWASISCTDTLQPFRNLHSVHLQVRSRAWWGEVGLAVGLAARLPGRPRASMFTQAGNTGCVCSVF